MDSSHSTKSELIKNEHKHFLFPLEFSLLNIVQVQFIIRWYQNITSNIYPFTVILAQKIVTKFLLSSFDLHIKMFVIALVQHLVTT